MDGATKRIETGELTGINTLNPYLQGVYEPVKREVTALELEVIGEIPKDLFGGYYRNGPNPVHAPTALHHWFDGDGMLHAIYFENGKAEYRNRYIQTDDHRAEVAGALDAGGILLPANRERSGAVYKDTANTDVVLHNGELMALWYVSGTPVRVNPRTLETIGNETFGGKLPRHVSAHSKVDGRTGEFVFFDYSLTEPWMSFGVVSASNELVNFDRVELPGPRLPHDMGLTENYLILHDLPVLMTETGLRRGTWNIRHADQPARFGVVPRNGRGDQVKWFETDSCYIYHVVNCWEEGDDVVMVACKMQPHGHRAGSEFGAYGPMVEVLSLHAVPVEWRMNMRTGACTQRQLDDRIGEFPVVNLEHTGYHSRWSYHVSIKSDEIRLLFDGLYKYDLLSGKAEEHMFEPGVYGSEPAFAPRVGATAEDDGYVITFVTDEATGRSEVRILDARNFSDAPVARVILPQRMPAGFHGTWAPGEAFVR